VRHCEVRCEIFGLGILIVGFKTDWVILLIKSGLKDPVKRLGWIKCVKIWVFLL
jgi:hypothetical protein